MNQEKDRTEAEESICAFCQTEVYEIEHDCLGQIFFNGIISATSFSELGPGIDKRFFASCSWLSLVSRKNKDFFRKWSVS